MNPQKQAHAVLAASTVSFTICFAVWMMNGVLITFLVESGLYTFSKSQMGWLIGIPVLSGALLRLPAGLLTDRFGGRPVFATMMLFTAAAVFLDSFADSFWSFLLGGFCFGFAGSTFAIGIAYSAVWYPRNQQGTALGIFGAGNAGAAITSMAAPWLLGVLTDGGTNLEGWRMLPRIYSGVLLLTVLGFLLVTKNKRPEEGAHRTLAERLQPLKRIRVWRFGLYYFLMFGGFVALAQWLIPYYVNVYSVSVMTAGLLATIFTLPSGVVRALGGWLSDKFGARVVMYWVLGGCLVASALLIVPRMDIRSPGEGVMAVSAGTVTAVSEEVIVVDGRSYSLTPMAEDGPTREGTLIWPTSTFGQEPVVEVGDSVSKKQLLASGITHIYFQANIWVFTGLTFIVGILMGIGKAGVYKHIPDYYPNDVGTVGGIVGVIGGLGGFVCPILFGYLLDATGIWTTTWMFFAALSLACLTWMHLVIRAMTVRHSPDLAYRIEEPIISLPLVLTCPVHGIRAHVIANGFGKDVIHHVNCSLLGGTDESAHCGAQCVAIAKYEETS